MSLLKIKRPIDQTAVQILEVVGTATRDLGIDCFLVGATARDIILTSVFDIATGRATRDIDFAIAVESWEKFEAIKKILGQKRGFQSDEEMKHRLYFGGEKAEAGYPIDLIPFGGVEQANGTLIWPPEMALIMNIIGYKEVLAATVKVEVAENLVVRIASLPGLAVLKLFAWSDRGDHDSKDAQDLYLILQKYCEAGNTGRLYNEEFSITESCGGDPNLAGAQLLGKDIAQIVSRGTHKAIMQILDDQQKIERLAVHMNKAKRYEEEAQPEVENFIERLKIGLQTRN